MSCAATQAPHRPGSAANNVLVGHGNNEILTGGQDRDLLIGGTGSAALRFCCGSSFANCARTKRMLSKKRASMWTWCR